MTAPEWYLLIGCLLLARGLTHTPLQGLPFTPAMIYLIAGIVIGPTVLNVFYVDPFEQSELLEILTEVAVLISLFSAGVKMPVPVSFPRWRAPLLLAWVSMTITVALIAGFAHFALGLSPGAAVLLGGILGPTDPVLATDVRSRHPGDSDALRFTLTSEAGMNDGSAFPFVMLGMGMLGLHDIGENGVRWILLDVLWSTLASIAIGVLCGTLVARAGWMLRGYRPKRRVLDDFVGLGLIAVAYGLSLVSHAWGFLAVFFAAVALRQTELKLAQVSHRRKERTGFDPESKSGAGESADRDPPATVSEEALVFQEHLERLSELLLVLLLGGMLFLDFWTWTAVGLALFVFIVARPVSVILGLLFSDTSWRIRAMSAWFGVRGIGSVYYLMYAIQHGLPGALARELIHLTLVAITLSILVHGISVKPMMNRFGRAGSRTTG